ncbi:MAG TPA: hypothetical protein PLV92_21165, partial [Pirellulaceae bacterium]|nr:hypothetical protein [Pirellulaceae bacterium]
FRVIRPSDPVQQRHEWRMAEYYGDDIYGTPYDDFDALDLDAFAPGDSVDRLPRPLESSQERLEALPPATPRVAPQRENSQSNGPQNSRQPNNGPTPPPEIRPPDSRPQVAPPRDSVPLDNTTRLRRRVELQSR